MKPVKYALVALWVGAAVLAAPGAYADSYHYGDRYYFDGDYARSEYRHDRYRHDRYGHDRYERRWHKRRAHHPGFGHGYRRGPQRGFDHPVHRYQPPPKRVIIRDYDTRGADYGHGYESATPTILGGIIGGVLGNQVGKGSGRDAATVAGALLGGSIGRDMGRRR